MRATSGLPRNADQAACGAFPLARGHAPPRGLLRDIAIVLPSRVVLKKKFITTGQGKAQAGLLSASHRILTPNPAPTPRLLDCARKIRLSLILPYGTSLDRIECLASSPQPFPVRVRGAPSPRSIPVCSEHSRPRLLTFLTHSRSTTHPGSRSVIGAPRSSSFHTRVSGQKVREFVIDISPDLIHHLNKRTASMYVPGGGSRARSLAALLFACSLLGVHGGSLIGCAASGTALRGHGGVRDFSPVMGKGLAACFLGPCAVPDVLGAAAATDRSALRLRGGSPTADGAHDEGGAGCRGRLVKIFVTYCGS